MRAFGLGSGRDVWLALLASAAIACGGKALTTGGGDSGEDSSGDSGGDATEHDAGPDAPPPDGPAPDGPWSPVCPASAPSEGAACSGSNVYCEYGCGMVFVCSSGTWAGAVSPMSVGCFDAGPSAPSCPGAISDIEAGAPCDDAGPCRYPTGLCTCNPPELPTPGGKDTWFCGPGAGCPFPRPRVGSKCDMAGQRCDYAQCGDSVQCEGGVWQPAFAGCGA